MASSVKSKSKPAKAKADRPLLDPTALIYECYDSYPADSKPSAKLIADSLGISQANVRLALKARGLAPGDFNGAPDDPDAELEAMAAAVGADDDEALADPTVVPEANGRRARQDADGFPIALSNGHPVEIVPLDSINPEPARQVRAKVYQETKDDYAERWRAGLPFPPIVVFRDGEGVHWLGDGLHRVLSAFDAEVADVNAEVQPGGRREAVAYALGANSEHGLRRSNADKRTAVTFALQDKELKKLPLKEIAERCRVTYEFVRLVRNELKGIPRTPPKAAEPTVVTTTPYESPTAGTGRPLDDPDDGARSGGPAVAEAEGEDDADDLPSAKGKPPKVTRRQPIDPAGYPLYARLAEELRPGFLVDLATYQAITDELASMRRTLGEFRAEVKGMATRPPYFALADAFVGQPAPLGGGADPDRPQKGWVGCRHCQVKSTHTGRDPKTGHACPKCEGRGYLIGGRGI